jgi:hypothetical protein
MVVRPIFQCRTYPAMAGAKMSEAPPMARRFAVTIVYQETIVV